MSIQVSGKHLAVGDALRSRIEEELAVAVGRFFERGGSADVVLSKDGHSICCDVALRLASGQLLQAKGLGGDAHAAFSTALEKIEARVRKYKRRLKNHHAHGAADDRLPAETAPYVVLRSPEDEADVDEDWEAGSSGPPAAMVVAETEADVKTLTVSGAVMALDLTDHPLVLFRNAAHGGLSVVYRRGDGNIGWIDPERTRKS